MNKRGKAGEDFAASYLEKKGYEVVGRNYHSRYGEIDLVCVKGPYLVFVEVKERKRGSLVTPLEAVTRAKREKLLFTAQQYLQRENPPPFLQPRFDVAAVTEEAGGSFTMLYLENAFGEADAD